MDGGAWKSEDKAMLLLHVHVLETLPQANPFTSRNSEVKQLKSIKTTIYRNTQITVSGMILNVQCAIHNKYSVLFSTSNWDMYCRI